MVAIHCFAPLVCKQTEKREMQKLCIALMVALGGALIVPQDSAEARPRHHHVGKHHGKHYAKHRAKHRHVAKHHHRIARKKVAYRTNRVGHSVSLAGVTPVLAAKARQIAATCGSAIISAVSRRGNRSNHPIGRAVDMKGNPGCIYAQLKGWPGGYSTDYAAVRHVHISYNPGGQEWGLRFAHGGTRTASARRFAQDGRRKSRGVRYARLSAPAYAMEAAHFVPARHSVH
jgi:hypothetical protein